MRRDKDIENLLKSYEVGQPDEGQIAECIKQAKHVVQIKKVRRNDSLWFFIAAQLKFMKGQVAVSFLFSLVIMLVLKLLRVVSTVDNLLEISVGIAPFLAVPIICSIVKSKRCAMMELECASRYSLQKVIVARMIINQALAIILIYLMWMFSNVHLDNFALNQLLFALISFEIASSCFLWFGKTSVKRGVFSVVGWMAIMAILLSSEKVVSWMLAVNTVALCLITSLVVVISMITIYEYVKNISFESEEAKWNLGWID